MRYFQAYTQYEVARWEMHLYHSCTEFKCFLWYSKIKLFLLFSPESPVLPEECQEWQLLPLRVTICLLFPVLKPLSFVNCGFFVICMTFFMIIRSVLEQSCIQNSTTCCLFKCAFCLWPSCSSFCPTYQWVHSRSRWKECRW